MQHVCEVIATALTGLAALLLTGGTTAHSRFGVPVPMVDEEPTPLISMQSSGAMVLRMAQLIVVDEATMGRREMYFLIDNLLRDVMRSEDEALGSVPFGGKVILLSGDFRQLTPVVPKVGKGGVLQKTLKRCDLWRYFQVLTLTTNMWVALLVSDPEAARRLAAFAQCADFLMS